MVKEKERVGDRGASAERTVERRSLRKVESTSDMIGNFFESESPRAMNSFH